MSAVYAKDRFLESLARCQRQEDFLASFYSRFFEADPVIKRKFRFTKMERQKAMLAKSLKACAAAVQGEPEGLEQLRELTISHDRFHHDVRPEWYPLWLDALLATAGEVDPQWCSEDEEAWRRILGHVIHHMASRYEG